MVTLEGTVTTALEELVETLWPPAGAAPDKVMVQVDWLPAWMEAGLHATPATVGGGVATVTVPPVAVKGIDVPSAVAPFGLVTPIAAVDGVVSVRVATVPFEIVVVLIPYPTHTAEVAVILHPSDLPAAVMAPPALTWTPVTVAG